MTDATHPPTPEGTPADEVLLQDLLDGRLDDAEAERVRARIQRESGLRETWTELRRIQAWVREHGPTGADLEPPPDFVAGVRARIATSTSTGAERPEERPSPGGGGQPPPPARPPRLLRMVTVAYAAAALLVVGFSVKYVFDQPGHDAAAPETELAQHDRPGARTRADEVVPAAAEAELSEGDDDASGVPDADAEVRDELEREREGRSREAEHDKKVGEDLGRRAKEPVAGGELSEAPTARRAPAPVPQPADAGGSAGGSAGGKKSGGQFGAPGGALPPGTRKRAAEPAGTAGVEPRLPAARSKAEDAAPSTSARLAAAVRAGEIIYVVETRDRARAEAALLALLGAPERVADARAPGLGRAPAPAVPAPPAAPGSPKSPPKKAAGRSGRAPADGAADRGAGGLWGPQGAFERVYRLDVEQALRLADVLTAAPEGAGFVARRAPAAQPLGSGGLFYSGELLRDVPSLAGLESLRRADLGAAPAAEAKEADGKVRGRRGAGQPSTPAAPAPDPSAVPAPGSKAKAPPARPLRVRILLLERR